MKLGFSSAGGRDMNLLGIVAGAMMIVLPFLGPWWIATVGTGAMEVALSPFDFSMTFLGMPLTSQLISYFLLAEKILMILVGVLMVIGSISPKSARSKLFVRFGVMKPFWAILGLIIIIVIGTFVFNNLLPNFISDMAGAGTSVQMHIPYLVGTANSVIQAGSQATIVASITLSFTLAFWVAVVTAALAIGGNMIQRRINKQAQSELTKRRILT